MYHSADNPEVVKAGYLTKSPPGDAPPMSQWRRRWFVLMDSFRAYPLAERFVRLEYYQNESEARRLSDPKGVIKLKNCTRVSGVARIKGHNFVFDICTKERTYHIAAETPTEKHEWMKTLNELLFTTSLTSEEQQETQDLEDAEIQRRKSLSKTSASRQCSLGELDDKQRPISCLVHPVPDVPARQERLILTLNPKPHPRRPQQQRRPLPPTPYISNEPPSKGSHQPLKASLSSSSSSSTTPSVPKPPTPTGNKPPISLAPKPATPPAPKPPTPPAPNPATPPVPKPRTRNSNDNAKLNTSSLSQLQQIPDSVHSSHNDHFILTSPSPSSSGYVNVLKPKEMPDYEDIDKDESSSPSSGYVNILKPTTVPDYEDIDKDEPSPFPSRHDDRINSSNHGDRILFLKGDDYADPDEPQDSSNLMYNDDPPEPSTYEVPVNLVQAPVPPRRLHSANVPQSNNYADPDEPHDGNVIYNDVPPESSTYEVPVNLVQAPVPPRRLHSANVQSAPTLSDQPQDSYHEDMPPVPPPRSKGKLNVKRENSLHGSLLNIADEGLYSELNTVEDEDEHYEKLIRIGPTPRERRFSNPDIIPISSSSSLTPPTSPLFLSLSSKMYSPPPLKTEGGQKRHYYENTGYASGNMREQNTAFHFSDK